MHSKLSKPPLTYVVAQIKFPNIENIAHYIPQLQDSIRSEFPFHQPLDIPLIEFRDGQQKIFLFQQWHFVDKNRRTGIILDSSSITLHTNEYNHFESLLEQFKTILLTFNNVLHINLLVRIGLRYINCIIEDIEKIKTGLLGFNLHGAHFKPKKFLTKVETTQITGKGIIKVQTFHLGSRDVVNGIQNIFVPPELAQIANFLSFESYQQPRKDFLLLDLDHFHQKEENFDITQIETSLKDFEEIIYNAFCIAVREKALEKWE